MLAARGLWRAAAGPARRALTAATLAPVLPRLPCAAVPCAGRVVPLVRRLATVRPLAAGVPAQVGMMWCLLMMILAAADADDDTKKRRREKEKRR